MFFLDLPYVSKFLQETLKESKIPVVATEELANLKLIDGLNLISEKETLETLREKRDTPLYCTSENSIRWIVKNLPKSPLLEKISVFKDKLRFRKLISPLYPDFYFKEIKYEDFNKISYEDFPKEFILKPTVGFMSAGVYRISTKSDFESALKAIKTDIKTFEGLYPSEVLDMDSFIVEEVIEGEEYAVDVYFDSQGEPVILNILKHMFKDDEDVGDRVYLTSKTLIKENLEEFKLFLSDIAKLADIKNLALHVELRKTEKAELLPIEMNPMRFGGWCTTADITYMAYGFNPYLYYYQGKKPNWDDILKSRGDEMYSIVVLDNSTGISTKDVDFFDYEKLLSRFKNPMELRKIDFKTYPVFGFLFVKTEQKDIKELEDILSSDLREFITL